jgi:two-component system chemotaxis family response regulator WspR
VTPVEPKAAVVVLLVDDQPIVAEAVRRLLAPVTDIQFHYCRDPLLALEAAERLMPAVILQDLMMPGVDGLTLVRAYRANPTTTDIPIIVLSMKEEPAIKGEAFACGANDYLVKLPDGIELVARLRHHATSYRHRMQRDQAYRALHESQRMLLRQNLELERLTNVDGLTGLSNRRYFDDFTTVQWKLAIRERRAFSILMIDVDDFKKYNDCYGHIAGDLVLKRIAEEIRARCQRPNDLVARFGGEEFVVSLSSPLDGATVVAERICQGIEALDIAHAASTVGKVVTVSIGGASTWPIQGDEYLPLIEAADLAMYEAKLAGRNRVILHAKQSEEGGVARHGARGDDSAGRAVEAEKRATGTSAGMGDNR